MSASASVDTRFNRDNPSVNEVLYVATRMHIPHEFARKYWHARNQSGWLDGLSLTGDWQSDILSQWRRREAGAL